MRVPYTFNYLPVVISHEEEPAEETVRDNDGILSAPSFLHVSVKGLQKRGHSIVDIRTTSRESMMITARQKLVFKHTSLLLGTCNRRIPPSSAHA